MIKLLSASLLASTIVLTGCGSKNNENKLTSEQKQALEKRKERASQKGNILDGFDPNKDSAKPSGNGLDSYKPNLYSRQRELKLSGFTLTICSNNGFV